MKITRRSLLPAMIAAALLLPVVTVWADAPRNVILMIGDGMGFEPVKAASLYATGKEGGLSFERHHRGEMMTHPLAVGDSKTPVTDSAAAGTAMATGRKTTNKRISQTPDGEDMQTVLEFLAGQGKWTGLVTTAPMTHATPATFGAHAGQRTDYSDIAECYFTRSRPNVLFGAYFAKGAGVTGQKATDAGYTVVKTRDEMNAFVEKARQAGAGETVEPLHVSGQFAAGMIPWEYAEPVNVKRKLAYANKTAATCETTPHLSEMTDAALALLARGPKGFFLMVEGGTIDWAGHDNVIEWSVFETVEFAKACQAAFDWAKGRSDTLIIVTADHETGDLKVVEGRGKDHFPEVTWGSRGHTAANVPVYGVGVGAERLKGTIDNTDLWPVMTGADKPAPAPAEPAAVAN
ncbi:MAG TPA: alkaline phosphatase [Phycisphaerae bacterium]|nr:alkaline phosphatase [Phycisphaerae bacterium]